MNATTHADPPAIDTGVAGERRRHRLPTRVERLARFVCCSDWNDISEPARDQLKVRLIDFLGVSFGALDRRAAGVGPRARAGVRRSAAADADRRGPALGFAIDPARRSLDAGAYMNMIASEAITEEVTTWRRNVVAAIAFGLGLEKVMFEAADPEVFGWYVNYGPEVNFFVDDSQIVQLECLRRGIWGTKSLWGRVVTCPAG
jgi:hypothetical protein